VPSRRHHSGARVEPCPGLRRKLAPTLPKDKILLVNLSGRGDKDMHTVAEKSGIKF
jgi:tryptophan synthase beta subunit